MERFVLVYVGEIALKKGNRDFFERILMQNIRKALADITFVFEPSYGRFCLKLDPSASEQKMKIHLGKVFGISHFRFAVKVRQEFEKFAAVALELAREKLRDQAQKNSIQTFCVRVNRSQKNFPKTSVELEREIGAYLLQHDIGLPVRLQKPDMTVWVELVNRDAFVSVDDVRGSGGLPVGSVGRVVSLLSAGIDSPVASYRMMKRGAKVFFVHFHSYPFTDAASQDNVREIVKVLNRHQYESKIYFVPFGEFQRMIMLKAPAKLRVILYRRMMMKIAEQIAQKEKCRALTTGESLGQVASQTMENLFVTNNAVSLPVFRPLIGMDKEEIIAEARRIGTYDISIQPYGDCCSLFVPEHPEIKADIKEVQMIEEQLDYETLSKEISQKITVESFSGVPV